jgi:hypothetical protein
MKFRAIGTSVVGEDDRQILVVLPVNCSKKFAREAVALLVQHLTHQEDEKERKKVKP